MAIKEQLFGALGAFGTGVQAGFGVFDPRFQQASSERAKFIREERMQQEEADEIALINAQNDQQLGEELVQEKQAGLSQKGEVLSSLRRIEGLSKVPPGPSRDAILEGLGAQEFAPNAMKLLKTGKQEDIASYLSQAKELFSTGDLDASTLARTLADPSAFSQAISLAAESREQQRSDPEGHSFQVRMRAINNRAQKLEEEIESLSRKPVKTKGGVEFLVQRIKVLQAQLTGLNQERDRLATPQVSEFQRGLENVAVVFDPYTGEEIALGSGQIPSVYTSGQRLAQSEAQFQQREGRQAEQFRVGEAGRFARSAQIAGAIGGSTSVIPLTDEERRILNISPQSPLYKTRKGEIRAIPGQEQAFKVEDQVQGIDQAIKSVGDLEAHINAQGTLIGGASGAIFGSPEQLGERESLHTQALFAVGIPQVEGALQLHEQKLIERQIQSAIAEGKPEEGIIRGGLSEAATMIGGKKRALAALKKVIETLESKKKQIVGKAQTLRTTTESANIGRDLRAVEDEPDEDDEDINWDMLK